MLLVDTSVWINLLGRKPSFKVSTEQLFSFATCPPVIQELLQGFPADQRYERLRASVLALPCFPETISLDLYLHAADIYRSGRRRGVTIRSSTDCLIAAIAISNRLTVWQRDRDFAAIAAFTDLKCVDSP